MKVLLVNGSPHKNGCTSRALTEVADTLLKEGIQTRVFWIGSGPVGGCTGCRACARLKKCIQGQDAVNEFLDIAGEYDGFVFGTPVHFGGAAGNMTSFMDRVCYVDVRSEGGRYYLKPAAAVVSARRAGTTATWDQMNKYFGIMQMPVITSHYWNLVHGAKADQVDEDEEGLQTMRTLARNMAFFLKCKEKGLENGVSLPERESMIRTNFVRQ